VGLTFVLEKQVKTIKKINNKREKEKIAEIEGNSR
jgi:hypothetical protein